MNICDRNKRIKYAQGAVNFVKKNKDYTTCFNGVKTALRRRRAIPPAPMWLKFL